MSERQRQYPTEEFEGHMYVGTVRPEDDAFVEFTQRPYYDKEEVSMDPRLYYYIEPTEMSILDNQPLSEPPQLEVGETVTQYASDLSAAKQVKRKESRVKPAITHIITPKEKMELNIQEGNMDPGEFIEVAQAIEKEVGEVIVGQKDIVRNTLIAIIASNHVLLEGVPGLGKTLLVKSFAEAMHLDFNRVQFTPDLVPADVTGTNIFVKDDQGGGKFQFEQGPIFANIVLADELNRATPRTQSALLESMQERTVTAAGHKYPLPEPFFVLATQNPIEQEGVYPLAEAAQDRFFFKLLMQFPSRDESYEIQKRTTTEHIPTVKKVADGPTIIRMEKLIRKVPILKELEYYAIDLVLATHQEQNEVEVPEIVKRYVEYDVENERSGGASPRGYQTIILAAKARAILEGRYNVSTEDIQEMAFPALRHRIALNFEGQNKTTTDDVIRQLIEEVPTFKH